MDFICMKSYKRENADIKKLFKKTALFVRLGVYKVQRVRIIIVVIRKQKKSKKTFCKKYFLFRCNSEEKRFFKKGGQKKGRPEVKKTI